MAKMVLAMNLEERRKYDPRIAIGRIKKILVMIFIIGIFGFFVIMVC